MRINPSSFTSATLPANKYKNRLVNILPCEFSGLSSLLMYNVTSLDNCCPEVAMNLIYCHNDLLS